MTDVEGGVRFERQSSASGKTAARHHLQGPDYSQNIRMQGHYPDTDEFVNKFEQRFSAGPVG